MKTPKVTFIFDREEDLFNIWDTANFESSWADCSSSMPSQISDAAKGKKFEECKLTLAKMSKKLHDSPDMEVFVKALNKLWEKLGNRYFEILGKVTGKPFCCNDVKGYITTVGRCPYNAKKEDAWFMVSFYRPIYMAITTAAHELFHIQFHNYFWEEIEKKLGRSKTADLKEALTVLLNIEFNEILIKKDEGYDCHKELREFIVQEWEKEKDFQVLLDKCVEWLKE